MSKRRRRRRKSRRRGSMSKEKGKRERVTDTKGLIRVMVLIKDVQCVEWTGG